MIYYINIILIIVVFFLVLKMYTTREGLIDYIESPKGFVPFVPVDSLCMVLALMGIRVNKFGSAFTMCGFEKKGGDTQPDTSNSGGNNTCPA